jgi:hypothetical protein
MRVGKILESNEKKLYIDIFLPEAEIKDDKIVKKEYITIKKMPYAVKKKITFLATGTMSGKTGKHVLKKMKQKGIKISDIDKMSENDQLELMESFEIDQKETENITNMTLEVTRLILEHGIDKKQHSFVDENDKPIELNYEFWEYIGSTELVDYIVKEIKAFSDGYLLGE